MRKAVTGKRQMEILELFNARQPHYLQHEVAIRHWDGYWFGKDRQYGDTYPHYWSALTGNVYMLWYRISGEERYLKMAENSLRGVLSLFFPDGSASCAYVFPVTVNGKAGQRYDEYANDQDWGMYFYLDAFGTGFDRVFKLCALSGVDYEFRNDEYGFTFIFKRTESDKINDKISDKKKMTSNVKLVDVDDQIIKILKENAYSTIAEIADAIGKSAPTVHRHIDKLVSLGMIERVGSRKSGYWEVKN